mgnify:CR=1 FL=1
MERHGRGHTRHGNGMTHHRRMGRGRFFEGGEMRLTMLALIAEQPRHGYDLMTEMETRSGGVYRPSAGSVYPKLQQLEDEGLITATREDGKIIYSVIDAGLVEVERERETIDCIWERAKEWGDWGHPSHPAAMEIARHVDRFAKTAFMAVTRRGVDPDVVRQIIGRAQREIEMKEAD